MNQTNQKQFAGVWLDHHKATIIAMENEDAEYTVLDKVESAEEHGGSSEHSIHKTEQADQLKYFKSVAKLLVNYDEVLLFGPGTAQEQFQKHLQEDTQFKNSKIVIDSSDKLTDPQMISKVREFFKSRQS